MPIAAGFLDIVCCLISLPLLLYFTVKRTIIFEFYPLVMAVTIVAWLFALIGGIFTLTRKSRWMAMAGSLAAAIIFLPFLFTQNDSNFFLILFLVNGFVGLISLGFVLSSRKWFEGKG